MKTIKDLRETLFETIAAVRNGSLSVDKANAVAGLSREIVGSLKAENEFRKQMGIKAPSEFLPDAVPPTHPKLAPAPEEKPGPYGISGKLNPERR